ncbi:hypothetical protein GcM3_223037 [Golovinomyces cichoracearum]|uniref:Uncharacterized protein n=1 Tax=Golovinomyces cichoracearum TaxID=62708 RepID=A0A420GYN6_9PEZI|nr:hypothetical protein GcM3_223037 [Golovinomyces cichoracearum]
MYHPKDAIQDPNLIRENETLEAIDEFSINNSTRHPHQLADTIEDTINWGSIYDSPSIYSTISNDNESEKADKISQTDKSILLEDDNPQTDMLKHTVLQNHFKNIQMLKKKSTPITQVILTILRKMAQAIHYFLQQHLQL